MEWPPTVVLDTAPAGQFPLPMPVNRPSVAIPDPPQQPEPVPLLPVPEIESHPPLFALPLPPILSDEGRELIIEFETGGRAGYNPHPEMPGQASGVTIGFGYDLRFNSKAVIRADWAALPSKDLERLVAAQGLYGDAARVRARELRDITIPWEVAREVFEKVTVTKFDQLCQRTWPGYDTLRDHAQDSLLSLTFNRGASLVGPKRRHMRSIASLSAKADYAGMAGQERAMIVVWQGTAIEKGMRRRRTAEARLMELP